MINLAVQQQRFIEILDRIWQDDRITRSETEELDTFLEDTDADDHALALYRHLAFDRWRETRGTLGKPEAVDVLEETVKRLLPGRVGDEPARLCPSSQAYFSSIDDCVGVIVDLFVEARRSAEICVFTITDDRIADAIVRAHKRGLAIRIVTDDDKAGDLGSDIDRLASLGIETKQDRTDRHMHHKFAIFDQSTLLTGSYNWTRGAADRNLENLIVTADPRLLRAFGHEFDRLWKQIRD